MLAVSLHTSDVVLAAAVFLACAVEMVEALTIVVAVGTAHSWKAAWRGVVAALVLLSALVILFGPALLKIPLEILRLLVGGLLLVFGLQWLRKAILRASGLKAKHDEDHIFAETVVELAEAEGDARKVAFLMAFKGVFLEGLEVVITVLTLGASAHRLGLAALSALSALVLVGIVGAIVARQLSGVPENAMKLIVGLMLVSFGTFWSGEGLGIRWPGSDAWILVLLGFYAVATWLMVWRLESVHDPTEVVR